jgi:regulator of protease activity HflC (stomatin/prohibitin superfamily)
MEERDVLRHLLEIEGQAAVLVDDAQAEADRRVKEAEEQNHLAYDGEYQKIVAELEAVYQKEVETAKAEYNKSLDEYRMSLDAMPRDGGGFSGLAFSLLVKDSGGLGTDVSGRK